MSLPDSVAVATIITFGTIITGLLSYLGVVATGARRHAKAARVGVENEHPTNLRDDLDEKFEGLAELVKTATADIGGLRSDIRGIRREALLDREAATAERERVRILEQTLTPTQVKRLRNQPKE